MIFPDRFPENQKFDNSKEKEFYIRFKRELPSDWDMFYSLKFKMPGVAVREIDYVILSPFGVFLIELKNARFKFYDSTWLIYDSREKRWKPHKKSQYSGPVEQVLSGITNFIEFLKINHHETLPTTEESFAGLVFLNKNEAGQINKQIKGYENILFHKDLDRFKLDTLILEYSIKNDIPKVSDKDLKTIKEIILLNANYVPSYQTRREEQRKIIYALTAEQLLIIDQINKVERLSISGVPGSGKTLLALRALEILDSLKWKTLFLSPTLAMASQFKSHTEDLTNLTIETFQNFSNISSSNKFD
ncbi:MAG: NERD domain-containing protein/DEAD/DEAH box helicase, partial [Leptospiraceae bacterium]|nr:NERD domain-containing protein/DEAD/DEAH box helicase [Leptospiraceae bacterium]